MILSETGKTKAARKPTARARITNGSTLLPDVDGRSVWARIMCDSFDAMVGHCGGDGYVTEPQRKACRRVAALEAELVHLEARFARVRAEGGEPSAADLDLYGRLANGQRRHLEALGYQRVPRDVTPDPLNYRPGGPNG